MFPELTDEQQRIVADTMASALASHAQPSYAA
jgi:hypothetical protein